MARIKPAFIVLSEEQSDTFMNYESLEDAKTAADTGETAADTTEDVYIYKLVAIGKTAVNRAYTLL